jgi:hypothetical protein
LIEIVEVLNKPERHILSSYRILEKCHLFALIIVCLFLITSIQFLAQDTKILVVALLVFPVPSFLYGKIWAKNVLHFMETKNKINKRKLFYAPSPLSFYLILLSFIVIHYINKNHPFYMKLVLVVEIWCIYFIFYALGFCSARYLERLEREKLL